MKILLVYPQCPDTFWSFRHALRFVSQKAGHPPLGLLTVAALLPDTWEKRLVDLNVRELTDSDIRWADYVFLGAMSVQQGSARTVIRRCQALGARIVAGGPLFTARHEDFDGVDHFVLNEAEITLPLFLADLAAGCPQPLYTTDQWADIRTTPVPLWDLIRLKDYATMDLQYSRGCPFDCEFCDITVLYGRVPRTKTCGQVIAELDSLYHRGWRGHVFVVDDNFIGNKVKVKREILPAITRWMAERNRPITLSTEVSLNLADDDQLLGMMAGAGFNAVFVGIESPNEDSLAECGKEHNRNRDLLSCIHKIQRAGLEVQGGFIVGFDSDPVSIFERLASFIQESGIVTAMVGLLNAPRGTRLYHRLAAEGRLLENFSGDNTDATMNFVPRMNRETLLEGYRNVLATIYAPRHYYARVKALLRSYQPDRQRRQRGFHLRFGELATLFKSVIRLGLIGRERYHYWKLLVWSLFCHPRRLPEAITFAIYGFHYRKVFEQLRSGLPAPGA